MFGTPLYLTPEVIKQEDYDTRVIFARIHYFMIVKVDIWAIGCVLYQLISLNPPFAESTIPQLMKSILHKNPKPIQAYPINLKLLN
jgi:NIMA (never in mitosis gene a)-related kinase 1/4/5